MSDDRISDPHIADPRIADPRISGPMSRKARTNRPMNQHGNEAAVSRRSSVAVRRRPGTTAHRVRALGGGNQGVSQVGMLHALLEHGIVPDVVIGTSAGALNGSAVAYAPT